MKKWRELGYGCIAILLAACNNGVEKPTDKGDAAPRSILQENRYVTGPLEKRLLRETFTVSGRVEAPPQSRAEVYPEVGAFVEEVYVIKGQSVEKGQRLVSLRHPNIMNLQQRFLEALNRLEQYELDYQRKQKLVEDEAISRKDLEQARALYRSTQSEVAALRTTLGRLGLREEDIAGGSLSEMVHLRSPLSGHILRTRAGVGQFAGTDQPLFSIVSDQHLHLELEIPPSQINKVHPGQPLYFRTPTHKDSVQGEVYQVNRASDGKGFFNAHAHFADSVTQLRPGSFAQARLVFRADSVYALPREALTNHDGREVALAVEDDHFTPIPVVRGRSNEKWVEIRNHQELQDRELVLEGVKYLLGETVEHGH